MSWLSSEVKALIQNYERHPCLYAIKDKNYTNRNAKRSAMEEIVKDLKSIKSDVTEAMIKSKWNALRNNFMLEHKKVVNSQKSGAGADDIYKPTVWYYSSMLFLRSHVKMREASYDSIDSTIEVAQSHDSVAEDTHALHYDFTDSVVEEIDYIEDPEPELPSTPSGRSSTATQYTKQRRASKQHNEQSAQAFFGEASESISKLISSALATPAPSDNLRGAFGNYVTNVLKLIKDDYIRTEAEQEIASVMYKHLAKDREAQILNDK